MSYSIETIPSFDKELKILSKKYVSLKSDYFELVENLEKNPLQGISLGKDCFKVRLAIKSKGKGKSGGARVIICVKIIHRTVYLLSIYDKSEKENLTDTELKELLLQIQ